MQPSLIRVLGLEFILTSPKAHALSPNYIGFRVSGLSKRSLS